MEYKWILICSTDLIHYRIESRLVSNYLILNFSTQWPPIMANASNEFPIKLKNTSLFERRGFFAGKWRDAASNKAFPVTEPSSGQVLAHCADFSQGDFEEAIQNAEPASQEFFSGTTAKQRALLLREWNRLILKNAEDRKPICSPPPTPSINRR